MSKNKEDEAKGKLRADLVPVSWTIGDAEVLTFGNEKGYPEFGYLDSESKLFLAAALRHFWAYRNGQTHDPESGLHHLKHVRVNLGIIMDIEKREQELYNAIDELEEALEAQKEI